MPERSRISQKKNFFLWIYSRFFFFFATPGWKWKYLKSRHSKSNEIRSRIMFYLCVCEKDGNLWRGRVDEWAWGRRRAEGRWGGHIHFSASLLFAAHCVGPHKSQWHEYMQKTIKGITCYFYEWKFMAFLLRFPRTEAMEMKKKRQWKVSSASFVPVTTKIFICTWGFHHFLRPISKPWKIKIFFCAVLSRVLAFKLNLCEEEKRKNYWLHFKVLNQILFQEFFRGCCIVDLVTK